MERASTPTLQRATFPYNGIMEVDEYLDKIPKPTNNNNNNNSNSNHFISYNETPKILLPQYPPIKSITSTTSIAPNPLRSPNTPLTPIKPHSSHLSNISLPPRTPKTPQMLRTPKTPTTINTPLDEGISTSSLIALIENQYREVGIARLILDPPSLQLYQFTDTPLYTKTASLLEAHPSAKILVPLPSKSQLSQMIKMDHPQITLDFPRVRFSEPLGAELIQTLSHTPPDIANRYLSLSAAAAVLFHAQSDYQIDITHHSLAVSFVPLAGHLLVDAPALRDLQILSCRPDTPRISTPKRQHASPTLFGLLDRTATVSGSRFLRATLASPLASSGTIVSRFNAVLALYNFPHAREELFSFLNNMPDLAPAISFLVTPTPTAGPALALDCFTRLLFASKAAPLISETLHHLTQSFNPPLNTPKIYFHNNIDNNNNYNNSINNNNNNNINNNNNNNINNSNNRNNLNNNSIKSNQDDSVALLEKLAETLDDDKVTRLFEFLSNFLDESLPLSSITQLEYAIKPGVIAVLDVARKAAEEAISDMQELCSALSEKSGIKFSLRFNKSRGYFLTFPNPKHITSKDNVQSQSDSLQNNPKMNNDENGNNIIINNNINDIINGNNQMNKATKKSKIVSKKKERSLQKIHYQASNDHNSYGIYGNMERLIEDLELVHVVEQNKFVTASTYELLLLNRRYSAAIDDSIAISTRFVNSKIDSVIPYLPIIYSLSETFGLLDMLISLAEASSDLFLIPYTPINGSNNNNNSGNDENEVMMLKGLKNSILEKMMESQDLKAKAKMMGIDSGIIKSDVMMSKECRMMIITGANMSGKSTLLRAIAHSAILHQIGCFLPANETSLPIFNAIYSRSGTSESPGSSAFSTEMSSTGAILSAISNPETRALVIFDEPCASTSPSDGLAISWAILESIMKTKSYCFCATHLSDLKSLSEIYPGVSLKTMKIKTFFSNNNNNYNVKNDEEKNITTIVGENDDDNININGGFEIAKRFMPEEVIERAREAEQRMRLMNNQSNDNRRKKKGLVGISAIINKLLTLSRSSMDEETLRGYLLNFQAKLLTQFHQ